MQGEQGRNAMSAENQKNEEPVSSHCSKPEILPVGINQPALAGSRSWLTFDTSVAGEDRKRRELMALAFACATFCPHCIELRLKGAKAAGASQKEINEASLLAAVLRAETPDAMALQF
jgi:AhpD family alkylhydroperoxidase